MFLNFFRGVFYSWMQNICGEDIWLPLEHEEIKGLRVPVEASHDRGKLVTVISELAVSERVNIKTLISMGYTSKVMIM